MVAESFVPYPPDGTVTAKEDRSEGGKKITGHGSVRGRRLLELRVAQSSNGLGSIPVFFFLFLLLFGIIEELAGASTTSINAKLKRARRRPLAWPSRAGNLFVQKKAKEKGH